MKAWVVPAMCPMPKAHELFDEFGIPANEEAIEKRVEPFIKELLWCIEANRKMETK
jgi:hypothetical protein